VDDEKFETTPPAMSAYKTKSKILFQIGKSRLLVETIIKMPEAMAAK
jgi:hypothetical protein